MPGQQPRVLEEKAHVRLQRLDLGVADVNRSARRTIESRDQAKERGLAATGAADNRQQLSGRNEQIEAGQDAPVSEGFGQAIKSDVLPAQ